MTDILYYDDEVPTVNEYCRCGSLTKTVSSFSQRFHYDDDSYSIEVVKTLKCLTCEKISVVLYRASGIFFTDETASKDYPPSHKYTRSELFAPKRRYNTAIPWSIDDVMNQAEAVLANSPRASFILCRAVLEEICADFKIPKERPNRKGEMRFIILADRLDILMEQEKISPSIMGIFDGVRLLGNEGTHGEHSNLQQRIQNSDAEKLIELVQYLLERIYVSRERARIADENLRDLRERVIPEK